MATDYKEMEREFVDGLAADTGKDLSEWMAAIVASGLTERNEIIDWLRLQGFQFSWASWLERIHHNGGRLVYDDEPEQHVSATESSDRKKTAPRASRSDADSDSHRVTSLRQPLVGATTDGAIAKLLQDAKGLKPLAELVIRKIGQSVEGVRFSANPPLIVAAAPEPFLALLPHPKKLRIYGGFPTGTDAGSLSDLMRAPDASLKGPAPFPAMMLLDDARRVDSQFAGLIQAAAASVSTER